MNSEVRRGHPRRRARGPDARDAAAAASSPRCRSGARAPRHPVPRGRAQGRRIVGRDRRALFRHGARTAASTSNRDQLRKFGFRFFFSEGAQRHRPGAPSSARAAISRRRRYQLDRGIFENFLGEHARALGVRVRRRRSRAQLRHRRETARRIACASSTTARAAKSTAAGSSTRPAARASSSASSVSREANDARRQRGVVPHRRQASTSTSGRTDRGVARALRSAASAGSRPIICAAKATGRG